MIAMLSYWLLLDSEGGTVIVFSYIPNREHHHALVGSSKQSLGSHRLLVKINRRQTKAKRYECEKETRREGEGERNQGYRKIKRE